MRQSAWRKDKVFFCEFQKLCALEEGRLDDDNDDDDDDVEKLRKKIFAKFFFSF